MVLVMSIWGKLGGAAAGFLLIKFPKILNFANFRRGPRMRYRP